MSEEYKLVCVGCGREPDQIQEYRLFSRGYGWTPAQFVEREEGTLNPENGHFACSRCYIAMGMPTGEHGKRWVAP